MNISNYNITPLFSFPLYSVKENFINDEISEYILSLKMINNQTNFISENKNILTTDNKFKNLYTKIKKHINFYIKNILQIDALDIFITQSWINKNKKLNFHHDHCHPNSILSGVIHFNDNESQLIFQRDNHLLNYDFNIKTSNVFNCYEYNFKTEKNSLFIFPSNLKHRVTNNSSDKDRFSLSFNTFFKGTIGDKNKLTLLKI
jgi:uncharacterized protein (TIGR02466 family)